MKECPYCSIGLEGIFELEVMEIDFETGEKRYMCSECGYETWD